MALQTHRLLGRDADGRFLPGARLAELAAAVPDRAAHRRRARPGLGARRDRRERPALSHRRQRARLRRRRRTGHRAAHDRAGRQPAAADRRLRRPGAVRLAHRSRAGRGPGRRPSSARAPWPRFADAAGRSRSASARPASRRCRRRCATATATVVAALSISGPIERLGRTPGVAGRPDPGSRRAADHRRRARPADPPALEPTSAGQRRASASLVRLDHGDRDAAPVRDLVAVGPRPLADVGHARPLAARRAGRCLASRRRAPAAPH